MSSSDETEAPRAREPLFNAPWPAVAVVVAILGSYAWQSGWGGGDAAADSLGFAPADLDRHRWGALITWMFVHGGWPHAIMNALGALAFGAPVARLLGPTARGVLAFFAFYLLCGVISGLGFAALHLHDRQIVVGASGAVSGLMGAAARLIERGDRLGSIWSRPVISITLGWAAANALLGVFGLVPFMPGARMAWEAHIAGYVAGVLLIPLFVSAQPGAEVTTA